MKRLLPLILAAALLLDGCAATAAAGRPLAESTQPQPASLEYYTEDTDGTIVAPDGTEYVSVCIEGFLELLGKKTRIGIMKGEEGQKGYCFELGLYACEQDADRVMLLRYMPDSEWGVFYRKKSAPALDSSYMNCVRLEFVGFQELQSDQNMYSAGAEYISSKAGISGKAQVSAFFPAVKAGGTARAGACMSLSSRRMILTTIAIGSVRFMDFLRAKTPPCIHYG